MPTKTYRVKNVFNKNEMICDKILFIKIFKKWSFKKIQNVHKFMIKFLILYSVVRFKLQNRNVHFLKTNPKQVIMS